MTLRTASRPLDDPMNNEHVALLRKGAATWNKWRREKPDIRPDLHGASLRGADLHAANLRGANLSGAKLNGAKLNGANLLGADLRRATLVGTNLTRADLTGCRVYGVSAWGLKLKKTKQQNLIITNEDEPEVAVDNIEVAQFIYLMLHNEKIRSQAARRCMHAPYPVEISFSVSSPPPRRNREDTPAAPTPDRGY